MATTSWYPPMRIDLDAGEALYRGLGAIVLFGTLRAMLVTLATLPRLPCRC